MIRKAMKRLLLQRPRGAEADSCGESSPAVLDAMGEQLVGGAKVVRMLGTPERSWREQVAELDRQAVGQVNTLSHTPGPPTDGPAEAPEECPAGWQADAWQHYAVAAARLHAATAEELATLSIEQPAVEVDVDVDLPALRDQVRRHVRQQRHHQIVVDRIMEQAGPRLQVWREDTEPAPGVGFWQWAVVDVRGTELDTGRGRAHAEAITVGWAALSQYLLAAPLTNARAVA